MCILSHGSRYPNDFVTLAVSVDFFPFLISFSLWNTQVSAEESRPLFCAHVVRMHYAVIHHLHKMGMEAEAAADSREYTYSRVNRASQPTSQLEWQSSIKHTAVSRCLIRNETFILEGGMPDWRESYCINIQSSDVHVTHTRIYPYMYRMEHQTETHNSMKEPWMAVPFPIEMGI